MSKTLVIVLSETRAHELTFDNFKKNVIDELNADLCLCIGVKTDYDYDNPFYKLAKYHFLYDESDDINFSKSIEYSYSQTKFEKYEELKNTNYIYNKIQSIYHSCENIKYLGDYDNVTDFNLNDFPENEEFVYHTKELNNEYSKKLYSIKESNNYYVPEQNTITFKRKKHYMEFLKIKNRIQEENDDPNYFTNFIISTYIHIFFLWFLQKNINEHGLLDKYDRFIIVRSDYIYQLPFPKIDLLNERYIWIPDSEDYNGLCDRLVVLSKYNIEKYINILENFYKKSNKYYQNIENETMWNMERILKMNLEENNIIHLVRRFPYISYCVRNLNGSTRYSPGYYNNDLGYYIKYHTEYEKSNYYKNNFTDSGLSIYQFYKEKILNINNMQEEELLPNMQEEELLSNIQEEEELLPIMKINIQETNIKEKCTKIDVKKSNNLKNINVKKPNNLEIINIKKIK
jgi:hypothetical protein